jgi:type IV pilus assembly protein PilW
MARPSYRLHVAARRARGLSLIELLISLALGLVLIGGVLYVYFGAKGSYRTARSSSRVQEAGNFGIDAMLRDVRQAGFMGCGSRMALNVFAPQQASQYATPPLPLLPAGQAVMGYPTNPTSAWVPSGGLNVTPLATGTDVLQMQVATGVSLPMVAPPDPSIPAVYLANNCTKIPVDTYLLVSNCTMATVVRVSTAPDTSANSCPAGGGVANYGSQLGVQVQYTATDSNGKAVNAFPAGTMALGAPNPPTLASHPSAQAFDSITYFVGQLAPRGPALYRYSNYAGVAEEVIDHVQDLCVMYGVNGAGGMTYVNAAGVAAAGGWNQVTSVQVSLLIAGDDLGIVASQPPIPWCNGATKTPTDGRVYQVFTSTAALRDQLP